MTKGLFSVPDSFKEVGILGCVWRRVLPILSESLGEVNWRDFFLFPALLILLQERALKWSHQMTGLWAIFASFYPQRRLQLGPVILTTNLCTMVRSVVVFTKQPLRCCSFSFIWSAPPPAGGGNSVLCTALSPTRLAQQSATPMLWKVGLFLQPHSAFVPHPAPTEQGQILSPPLLFDIGSTFLPKPTVSNRLTFTVYAFYFFSGRGCILAMSCVGLCSRGERVVCVYCAHLLDLQIYTGSFETTLEGWNCRWGVGRLSTS
jgi:hypothetical protein